MYSMRIFDRPHHNWVLSARQFLNVRTLIVEIAKNDNKMSVARFDAEH